MKGDKIKYYDSIKYVLADDYSIQTGIVPEKQVDAEFVSLSTSGLLEIRQGFPWDGPSGPTIDTKTAMRGSLVHDALYQLMREGFIPLSWRSAADSLLFNICKEDGMWGWRAWLWKIGVNDFAEKAAKWESERPIVTAP